jgi:dolichyl-phosphate-mannose--protein O-mannosyl transferase
MVLAAPLRLVHLGFPHKLIFDETYYVKDAYSLLRAGVELNWAENPNPLFEQGNYSALETTGEYVVHPPLGKWLIALGMWLFGPNSSFGWRFMPALAGIAAVLLTMLVARRVLHSVRWAALAGLFMAVDGQAIVLSRTGLLDGFLTTFTLLALWLVLRDREVMDRRLAAAMTTPVGHGPVGQPLYPGRRMGPGLGMRWNLLAAGVALGLACGVKWSGLYFLAVFGIMVVAWDAWSRHKWGIKWWALAGITRDGLKAFGLMVPVASVVYVTTWVGWLASGKGYFRDWADQNPGKGWGLLPGPLRSLVEYHIQAFNFHSTLVSPHDYQSRPWDWMVQWRPTSMFLEHEPTCGATACTQAITALGNPLLWWFGLAGFGAVLWAAVIWADRRAWIILSGYLAGWVPWLFFAERTIFSFYTVAFVPYVAMALAFGLGRLVGPPDTPPARARRGRLLAGIAVVLVVLAAAFFWPIWSGGSLPDWLWRLHYWLPSWP